MYPIGIPLQRKAEMDKEEEKQKIEELFGPHPLDLKGFSKAVKARFKEATRRTNKRNDFMLFLDGCEKGMIGTIVNEHGIEVPVYEYELSVRSKMESYGPKWAEQMGDYTEEQLADADFMESELYTLANDDFNFNTVRSLPYQHEHAPIIMQALHDIGERGDSIRWDMPIVGKLDKRWADAFVGTIERNTDCPVAVYEFGLFVKAVMAEMGVDAKFGKKLAKEYIDEGINGDKPVILYGFKVDADRWDALGKDINDAMMEAFFDA